MARLRSRKCRGREDGKKSLSNKEELLQRVQRNDSMLMKLLGPRGVGRVQRQPREPFWRRRRKSDGPCYFWAGDVGLRAGPKKPIPRPTATSSSSVLPIIIGLRRFFSQYYSRGIVSERARESRQTPKSMGLSVKARSKESKLVKLSLFTRTLRMRERSLHATMGSATTSETIESAHCTASAREREKRWKKREQRETYHRLSNQKHGTRLRPF